jgi:protein-tyrosine-phosphatase
VLYHIHRLVSAPLVLTSANRSGDEAPTTAGGVLKSLGVAANDPRLALVLDDGPTRFGRPSTVVRVDNDGMEILRSGAIEEAAMEQFAKPLIALVCTGNTCRSPMAETLLRDQLFKRFGCEDAARVVSAGLAASAGMSASPQAIEVMGRKSLDLTSHTSRPLDDSIIASADLILTMTQRHREAILTAFPTLSDRVFTLRQNGGDISDPVGCPVDVYQACADQIETELSRWMDRHIAALIPHPSHSSRTATRNSDDTTPGGQS